MASCDMETISNRTGLVERLSCEIGKFRESHKSPLPDVETEVGVGDVKELYKEMLVLISPVDRIDYHATITREDIDTAIKQDLWILRMRILFSVLVDVSENPTYKGLYKYGIYGSTNVTSDVDVSVSFVGPGHNQLHMLLQAIEDKFIELIGMPCLSLDIEFYASIIKVQDCITHVEKYMDLSSISSDDFTELKKLAWMSVLLNNRKRNPPIDKDDIFGAIFLGIDEEIKKKLTDYIDIDELNTRVASILEMKDVFDTEIYNKKCIEYYKKVEIACDLNVCMRSGTVDNNHIKLIIALANADLYREESYILLPTVLVVVHMKQRYDTLGKPEGECIKGQRVECTMNKYGYLLALLEQLGYMNRFHDKPDKIKKYGVRAKYCIEWYNKGNLPMIDGGGRRKHNRTKKRQRLRKTKRKPAKRSKSKKFINNI